MQDAYICSHPAANCELFLPFNRSLIVYATTRLEYGRFDELLEVRRPLISEVSAGRWREWLYNLAILAKRPNTVVAANSVYDACWRARTPPSLSAPIETMSLAHGLTPSFRA